MHGLCQRSSADPGRPVRQDLPQQDHGEPGQREVREHHLQRQLPDLPRPRTRPVPELRTAPGPPREYLPRFLPQRRVQHRSQLRSLPFIVCHLRGAL